MTRKSLIRAASSLILAGAVAVAGCTRPVLLGNVTTDQVAELQVIAEVSSGGYALLAPVVPYTSASINHLEVQLFTVDGGEQPVMAGGSPIKRDIPGAALSAPIVFSHLKPSTTYRVKAFAYKAAGTGPADLISTTDANSYVDVTVGTNERPTLASLKVKLIDKPFNGQATASTIVITEGQYTPSGSITVTPQ